MLGAIRIALILGGWALFSLRLSADAPLHLIVPAYFYPLAGSNQWATMTENPPTYVIFNPASGPGKAVDSNLASVLHDGQRAGIRMLGYVATDYGAKPLALVESDINSYQKLYRVTDIFIDECSSKNFDVAYYKKLTSYVKSRIGGAVTVLNAGTVPDETYMGAGDIIGVFEGDLNTYRKTNFPTWMSRYPGRFMHVIYDVPSDALENTVKLAKKNGAGFFYATNESMKDADPARPYGHLPSYYAAEIAAVSRP